MGRKAGGGPGGTRAGGKLTGEGLAHLVTKGPETATLTENWVFSPQVRADQTTQEELPVQVCASAQNALQQAGGREVWQSLSHSRKQVAIVCPAARRPGNLLEGGVSLTWKHRAPSHKDHPFPEQKREPSGCSVFNMTLLPFGCVTGILHMAYFLESDFLLLTLKKKKAFQKAHGP